MLLLGCTSCLHSPAFGAQGGGCKRHWGRVERPVYSSVLLSSLRTELAQLPPGHQLWSRAKAAPQLRGVRLGHFYFPWDGKAAADNRTIAISPGAIRLPPAASGDSPRTVTGAMPVLKSREFSALELYSCGIPRPSQPHQHWQAQSFLAL